MRLWWRGGGGVRCHARSRHCRPQRAAMRRKGDRAPPGPLHLKGARRLTRARACACSRACLGLYRWSGLAVPLEPRALLKRTRDWHWRVQKVNPALRFGLTGDYDLAERICCHNTMWAEPSGTPATVPWLSPTLHRRCPRERATAGSCHRAARGRAQVSPASMACTRGCRATATAPRYSTTPCAVPRCSRHRSGAASLRGKRRASATVPLLPAALPPEHRPGLGRAATARAQPPRSVVWQWPAGRERAVCLSLLAVWVILQPQLQRERERERGRGKRGSLARAMSRPAHPPAPAGWPSFRPEESFPENIVIHSGGGAPCVSPLPQGAILIGRPAGLPPPAPALPCLSEAVQNSSSNPGTKRHNCVASTHDSFVSHQDFDWFLVLTTHSG